jgi:hypothetical protein
VSCMSECSLSGRKCPESQQPASPFGSGVSTSWKSHLLWSSQALEITDAVASQPQVQTALVCSRPSLPCTTPTWLVTR